MLMFDISENIYPIPEFFSCVWGTKSEIDVSRPNGEFIPAAFVKYDRGEAFLGTRAVIYPLDYVFIRVPFTSNNEFDYSKTTLFEPQAPLVLEYHPEEPKNISLEADKAGDTKISAAQHVPLLKKKIEDHTKWVSETLVPARKAGLN